MAPSEDAGAYDGFDVSRAMLDFRPVDCPKCGAALLWSGDVGSCAACRLLLVPPAVPDAG